MKTITEQYSGAPVQQGSSAPLTETQAARILGMKVPTLRSWRMRGKGPVYLKISGRTIKYRLSDLDAFLEQSVTQPGARQ